MPTFLTQTWGRIGAIIGAGVVFLIVASTGQANPAFWELEWPETDFPKHSVPFEEIFSGGVPRDGIPPIYDPNFASIDAVAKHYKGTEPVIEVSLDGKVRAYPLSILMTHEIVNDELAGKKIAVTYCPLCSSAVVFDRNVNGKIHTFGVSGKRRNSDLVMWDHETQSWWQKFIGETILGAAAGMRLTPVPAQLESLARFRDRAPDGQVMVPADVMTQPDGTTPYSGMDTLWETQSKTMLLERYDYDLLADMSPLTRVVVVGGKPRHWIFLRKRQRFEDGDLVLT